MAKRFNIIRNIREEIKKGNLYVAPNGNFVSADLLNNEILNDFKRELVAKTVDPSVPFSEYREQRLSGYTTALDVMNAIREAFNLATDDEAAPETCDPAPETSETVPNDSEPKRGKSKGGDAK